MASDIVPIQLSLTAGDLVTLWAPRWREDGEEWEAFLGDDDALFAFPEVTQLAAFVRTATEHDLVDHPAWSVVPDLTVQELTPEETQRYDIVGVPELVAEDPDTWTIGDLAEITEMVRSIADVCELDTIIEVLGAAPGFALLRQGPLPFTTPEVDPAALAAAEKEVVVVEDTDEPTVTEADEEGGVDEEDEETGFWEDVGIDPVRITTRDGDHYTLRCYLDDRPVFLGSDGRIDVFRSERALARWLGDDGAEGHDLVAASTWPEIVERAAVGELEVVVDDLNAYTLTGLANALAEGPLAVDPAQLELATELLLDVGDWAGDEEPRRALAESQALGWLVSFVTKPDPTRLAPSPPFTAEATRFRELIEELTTRLRTH